MKKKSSYGTFKKGLVLGLCIFLLCLSAACRTEKDADRSTPPGDMAGTDYASPSDPSDGIITDIGDAARDGAEEIRDGLHDLTQDNVPGTVETQRR